LTGVAWLTDGDRQQNGGSSSHSQIGRRLGVSFENLTETRTVFAIVSGTADLEQEIGAAAGPAHLLHFGHAVVDQEMGRCFGQRGAHSQAGMMALGSVLHGWAG
jgi:hypothetical protein